jgi:hypothetical protein
LDYQIDDFKEYVKDHKVPDEKYLYDISTLKSNLEATMSKINSELATSVELEDAIDNL